MLHGSFNVVFKDITQLHSLRDHQTSNKARLGHDGKASQNIGELAAKLQRLRHNLSQEVINDHTDSMPSHVLACTATRGCYITYWFVTFFCDNFLINYLLHWIFSHLLFSSYITYMWSFVIVANFFLGAYICIFHDRMYLCASWATMLVTRFRQWLDPPPPPL